MDNGLFILCMLVIVGLIVILWRDDGVIDRWRNAYHDVDGRYEHLQEDCRTLLDEWFKDLTAEEYNNGGTERCKGYMEAMDLCSRSLANTLKRDLAKEDGDDHQEDVH